MADEPSQSGNSDERQRTLALLDDQHTFPGTFRFRVVIRPGLRAPVVQAVAAVVKEDAIGRVHERVSRNGNYLSLRLEVEVASAEQVLEVYEVLQRVDGVLAVL